MINVQYLNKKNRRKYIESILGNKCLICNKSNNDTKLFITSREIALKRNINILGSEKVKQLLLENKLILLCRQCNCAKIKLYSIKKYKCDWNLIKEDLIKKYKVSLIKNIFYPINKKCEN